MSEVINKVSIDNIFERDPTQFDIDEWGERLIKCFTTTVTFNGMTRDFKWVIIGDEINSARPEPYDEIDGYDTFLQELREGASWKKSKRFIWDFQSAIQMAIHHLYSCDTSTSTAVSFPIVIPRYKYINA